MAERHGTEVSFRLGPGTAGEARAFAADLAAATGAGCLRHMLFVDEERGEYGCLAEWPDRAAAERYAASAPVAAVLARIGDRAERVPRVRTYAMEEQASGA
jgi:quinol monooxygenase YgiN